MIKKILLILVWISMISLTFATANTQAVNTDTNFYVSIINLLNLIWMPFAILAGKLLTNDFVYGSFMHLDVILWKIWQFSKTISYYILAFILFFSIFSFFVWKTKNIWSTLFKIVMAAILIDLSWFLIWALLDISTLLLISVGAFPMKIINETNVISPQVKYCEEFDLNYKWKLSQILTCKKEVTKQADEFLSKANTLAGPLVYIWQSILWINKKWDTIVKKTKKNNGSKKDIIKVISIWTMIQLVAVVLFVIPIIILVFIGIVRIFWLRIYIWFSPLIILDQIFWWKVLSNKPQFQFKNMIWLIFQPVFIVFAMWISVIFLVSIQSAFTSKQTEKGLKELGICWKNENSFCMTDDTGKNKPVITIVWNLMREFISDTWWVIGYMTLFILTLLVLWSMIKVATKSSEITASISENIYNFAEESLKSIKFIPTPAGRVGIGALQMAMRKSILKRDFETKAAQQASEFLEKLWFKNKSDIDIWMVSEFNEKIVIARNFNTWLPDMLKFLDEVAKRKEDLIPAYAPNFQNAIYNAMERLYSIDSSAKTLFKNVGWAKDGRLVSKEKLFANQEFWKFLTGLFKNLHNPSIQGISNFSTLYHNVTGWVNNLISQPVKNYADKSQ